MVEEGKEEEAEENITTSRPPRRPCFLTSLDENESGQKSSK